MDRQQTIRLIHDYMAGQPVVKAWIFGSFARGEDKPKSDIDILFIPDFEKGSFTLLTHGGMYEDLKQLLGREVDLVVDGSLRPYAKESAERDKGITLGLLPRSIHLYSSHLSPMRLFKE